MNDFDALINFKWGSEPQGKVKRNSFAKRWLFCKPDCGNLSPSPQSPFSSFAVVPYRGGYPTGYSVYEHCSWSTPKKITDCKLKGFTHFAYSGCGDMKEFHNLFLVKPDAEGGEPVSETYSLNGMEVKTNRYEAKIFVNKRAASYSIRSKDRIELIPGFHGLQTKKYKSQVHDAKIDTRDAWILIFVDYGYISIYYAVLLRKGSVEKIENGHIYLSNDADFIIAYSLDGFDDAKSFAEMNDERQGRRDWISHLSHIDVVADYRIQRLFYTSLFAALKKPFIYDENRMFDIATMWDIYKTLLPLLFAFYKDEAKIIVNQMLDLTDEKGRFQHCVVFSSQSRELSDQAICLMNISLSMAYMYGVEMDVEKAKEKQKKEIEYYLANVDEIKRPTHILDLCDAITAYNNAYGVDLGLEKAKELIDSVFDKNRIYLNKKAKYYEGTYANYSFRASSSTPLRLDGDLERLEERLDSFFGCGGLPTIRFSRPTNPVIVKTYIPFTKRFEGLNNEPDMEDVYLYSYLDRFEKQNEIIECIYDNSFSLANDGLPGNDDNGGISAWLVWNLLGLFPIAGTNLIKIGLPRIQQAKIGSLTIKVHRKSPESIYLEKTQLNGVPLEHFEVTISDLLNGGLLEIYLK